MSYVLEPQQMKLDMGGAAPAAGELGLGVPSPSCCAWPAPLSLRAAPRATLQKHGALGDTGGKPAGCGDPLWGAFLLGRSMALSLCSQPQLV